MLELFKNHPWVSIAALGLFAALNAQGGSSGTALADGVTIASLPAWESSGLPATLGAKGLGSMTPRPVGLVSRQMHFLGSTFSCDLDLNGEVSVSVPGRINAITLLPYFSIPGATDPVQLPFHVMIIPQTHAPGALNLGPLTPGWCSFAAPFPTATTYSAIFAAGDYSSIIISLAGSDPRPGFYSYLANHNFPDTTFEFGVRIQSVDFTPAAAVPEPSTFSLISLGLLGLGWYQRQRRQP